MASTVFIKTADDSKRPHVKNVWLCLESCASFILSFIVNSAFTLFFQHLCNGSDVFSIIEESESGVNATKSVLLLSCNQNYDLFPKRVQGRRWFENTPCKAIPGALKTGFGCFLFY